jgi:hypothetical protein
MYGGEEITYPDFRIEWGHKHLPSPLKHEPYDFIQVCHEDCSYGILNGKNHTITFGDIIFNQLPYSPQLTNKRLDDLSKQNPLLASKIEEIKRNIFK